MKWFNLNPIVGSDGGRGGSVWAPLARKTPCWKGEGLVLLVFAVELDPDGASEEAMMMSSLAQK